MPTKSSSLEPPSLPSRSDYASAAGSNQTIAVFDELWAFASERARRLFDELVPPPTRKVACRLTVTYAGFSGESTLLEELYKRGLQQPEIAPNLYGGDGMLMFWSHEPVAPWQDERWLADMRRSLRPNQYLRMIENRFVTTESSFIDMRAWDQCVDPNVAPVFGDVRCRSMPASMRASSTTARPSLSCTGTEGPARAVDFAPRVSAKSRRAIDFEQTIERTVLDLPKRFSCAKCCLIHGRCKRWPTAGEARGPYPRISADAGQSH